MLHNEKPLMRYKSGADMWRDIVFTYGAHEAFSRCRKHFELSLNKDCSKNERLFLRELFEAMHETTAAHIDPKKLVYPYAFAVADERREIDCYKLNRGLNIKCADSIDALITDSCYKENHYNLEIAAIIAILDCGFQRICKILKRNYSAVASDTRLSAKNRQWADTFSVQEESHSDILLQSHPVVLNGFCTCVRELYQESCAERFALPGKSMQGEFVDDVEIKRAIVTFDNGNGFMTGYAIGHNPQAVTPWVCWQFAVREGKRHYNWGVYAYDEQTVIDSYDARIFSALN